MAVCEMSGGDEHFRSQVNFLLLQQLHEAKKNASCHCSSALPYKNGTRA